MREFRLLYALFLLLLLVPACGDKGGVPRETIPLVSRILEDRACEEAGLIENAAKISRDGDIYLLGKSSFCNRFAERFLYHDEKDNVDASALPDQLPDFAGETLVCLNTENPFGKSRPSDNEQYRRDFTVRLVLSALDTVSHISPYDLDGLKHKNAAKIIIFGDPATAEFGLFDADTLLRSKSCDIPLLSPVDMMLEKVFSSKAGRAVNVGILADLSQCDASVYAQRFREKAAECNAGGSKCVIFPTENRDSLLHGLLDSYSAGNEKPLDAVLVDDIGLDIRSLKFELADLLSILNESSMTYGRMIADGFLLLDSFNTVADFVYDYLRSRNLFTHNIAKPQVVNYLPIPKPETEDGSIILIPSSYVQN